MFKLIIKDLQGNILHAPTFETESAAIEHRDYIKSHPSEYVGFPLHEVDAQREADIVDADGNITGKTITYYKKTEPNVTYEINDIGDGKSPVEHYVERQAAGSKVLAFIAALNVSKNLSIQQYEALLLDVELAKIERLLQFGALELAQGAIAAYAGDKYTSQEKAQILTALAAEVAAL